MYAKVGPMLSIKDAISIIIVGEEYVVNLLAHGLRDIC
jgi:hypothetical protein